MKKVIMGNFDPEKGDVSTQYFTITAPKNRNSHAQFLFNVFIVTGSTVYNSTHSLNLGHFLSGQVQKMAPQQDILVWN